MPLNAKSTSSNCLGPYRPKDGPITSTSYDIFEQRRERLSRGSARVPKCSLSGKPFPVNQELNLMSVCVESTVSELFNLVTGIIIRKLVLNLLCEIQFIVRIESNSVAVNHLYVIDNIFYFENIIVQNVGYTKWTLP